MLNSSRTMYPLFCINRIGPYTRFINFSHAVRQEQSLPRLLSTTRYKGLAALHTPHHVRSVTTIPGDTRLRLRLIIMYEKIKRGKEETSQHGNSSKVHDVNVEQKGEKSSSEVKRKASKSSWALKQKAENAAFNKAIGTDQFDERYRQRRQWRTSRRPGQEREQILHRVRWDEQGWSMIDHMDFEWSHDQLDECMYYDENGRIQCVSEDGQVFFQEEWASTSKSGSGLDDLFHEPDLNHLSGGAMETTMREKKR